MNARLCYLVAMLFVLGCQPQGTRFDHLLTAQVDLVAGTPQSLQLPEAHRGESAWVLINPNTGREIVAQNDGNGQLLFLLDEKLEKGGSRSYRVEARPPAENLSQVHLIEEEGYIDIKVADQPVLRYHTATVEPPDSLPAYYRRSGFIHPLYSPGGQVVTDGMPTGHTHQHGLFFAWVNTTYQGAKTDFWNQQSQSGTVRHVGVKHTSSGPVFAEMVADLEHLSIRGTDTTVVLSEEWTLRVYHQEDPFLIDFKNLQKGVSTDTLFINQYHYGGLGFRGSEHWNSVDPDFVDSMQLITALGDTRARANHSQPEWVAAYGKIDGAVAGVAVKGSTSNFRSPQAVRVHPVMPYFVFAPMVDGAFYIAPGGTYESAYRIMVYDGQANADQISSIFSAWE